MSRKWILFGVLCTVLLACKKFKHEELNAQPSCDLCAFADSLSGTYRGLVVHNEMPSFVTGGNNYDSLTITVNHIFFDADPYGDSLYMNFETSFAFDSVPGITYDTIQIRSASGKVHASDHGDYYILPDSITIEHIGSFQTGPTNYIGFPKLVGILYRQ